jgi:hypothetical protein
MQDADLAINVGLQPREHLAALLWLESSPEHSHTAWRPTPPQPLKSIRLYLELNGQKRFPLKMPSLVHRHRESKDCFQYFASLLGMKK